MKILQSLSRFMLVAEKSKLRLWSATKDGFPAQVSPTLKQLVSPNFFCQFATILAFALI